MLTTVTRSFITFLAGGLLAAAAIAAPGAHGPDGEHLDAPASSSNATGLARLPDGSVNVPKQAQRRLAIRTVMTREEEHPLTVELNGRVGIDPNAGGRVQAPFVGRIAAGPEGLPMAGKRVEKGQVLLRLHPIADAIERGTQQAELADIRAKRALVEQRVDRLDLLADVVPQKEIEAAKAELKSLVGRERAIGASVGGNVGITAPASGIVATANVLAGQIVEARDVLFEIIDPRHMIIEAVTPDVSLAGRIAAATLTGYPDVELDLLGGGRRLRDGALPVNFRATLTNTALAVGQPVTVVAKLRDKVKGIVIPAEALVRNPANEFIVWIKSGAERFIAQPVVVRPLDATNIVVVKGLAPENRVVVSGAALINQIR
jgi:cobalt-zinc-cadmium efflux system membrane fusion protein